MTSDLDPSCNQRSLLQSILRTAACQDLALTRAWVWLPANSDQCGWSRVIGGVHFRAATTAASDLCAPIGKASHLRAVALRDGTSADRIDIFTVL